MIALALTCVLLLGYLYVGFPAVLWLRARLWPVPLANTGGTRQPELTVVICAYNEAEAIGAKLDSLKAQTYPADKLQILVASDGSSDATERLVADRQDPVITLLRLPRQGKVATLNTAVAQARGSILVFTDANSLLAPDALEHLISPFTDSTVGGVAGDQRYLPAGEAESAQGERAYWDLDRSMKRWQHSAGSVTSATGALYAMQRDLFEPLPAGVTDDFAASTLVIRSGRRLVFAEQAAAYEAPVGDAGDRARKARILTRGFNSMWHRRSLLNPFRFGFYAHQLLVQKLLRRLAFLPLAGLLIASLMLATSNAFWLVSAALQVAGWMVAILCARWGDKAPRLFRLGAYFWIVNSAAAVAAWQFLRGHRIDTWNPRGGEVAGT